MKLDVALSNINIFCKFFIVFSCPTMASKQLPLQKHRGFVRNLELIQEELSERQLADKSKQEEDEEKRKKEKAKMSKLNHNKNGNHGDGKLEEQGLIDPNENKIGEYHLYLDISWMRNTKIVKVPYTPPHLLHDHNFCTACEVEFVLSSLLLMFLTMPFISSKKSLPAPACCLFILTLMTLMTLILTMLETIILTIHFNPQPVRRGKAYVPTC